MPRPARPAPDAGRTPWRYAAPVARYKAAFLVRIWAESGDRSEADVLAWRGSVVHLRSQERRYFTDILDLAAFLTAHMRDTEVHGGDVEA